MKSSRKFSILTKKRIVEYYKSGVKDEKRIRQEYGLTTTLLENFQKLMLRKKKISISMTQYGDPYENILAERINKTIKEEFLDVFLFLNFEEAKYYTAKSIKTYNRKRPHASLDYFTPNQAHYLNGPLKKLWKNNKKYNNKKRAVKKK